MKLHRIHPSSLFAGLALGALVLVTTGQSPALAPAFEYRILVDVDAKQLATLAGEGWEYVGYLGQSPRGTSADETLWRRASR